MSSVEVASLQYYPIKSCGGVEADEVTFTEYGIAYDREWMLVNARDVFVTQRNKSATSLSLVQPRLEQDALHVTAPDMGELIIPLAQDPDAQSVPVTVWKKPGVGKDQGPDANEYFSDYLGKPVRLLRIEQPRQVKPECQVGGASQRTAFADGFPLLLASLDSLASLNRHLARPIPINRFRANIIIQGAPPYEEDFWRELRIGALQAFVVRACDRCPIPNVPQELGILPADMPVTNALKATRRGIDMVSDTWGDFFGQNMVHVFQPGQTVRVGDEVMVIKQDSQRNFLPADKVLRS